MPTLDFVGFVKLDLQDKTTWARRPAWVFWMDDQLKSLAEQIPSQMCCPFCQQIINLPNFRGTTLGNPDVFEFISKCPVCFTHWIFNKAPKDLRDQISWPQYPKAREEEYDGNDTPNLLAKQHGCP